MVNPWVLAVRPQTLPAAIAPVIIGTAMAFGDGVWHWPSAFAAAFAALMIQIATNLVNDYCDFKKGADKDRVGPLRVTQAGLIKPQIVLLAAIFAFLLAALFCAYLVYRAGFAILIIGIAAILSGIFYTAGKRPLGYLGLGDIFVFVFFGPVAVAGTYFVQALELNWAVIAAGMAPGFLSMAILAVNNLRDMGGDRRAGKLTLAVRFGRGFVCAEYLFCVLAATVTPFIVHMINDDHPYSVIAALTGFAAIPLVTAVCMSLEGPVLNGALVKTGRLLLVYSILFSAGWVLCSR